MSSTLQLKRTTAANWTSLDTVLAEGEIGVETDTLEFKIGDGTTAWTSLAYAGGGAGTVTSVGQTVPTGFSVSGSPVTGSGTLAITYAGGYQGYTTTEASKLAGIASGATANTGTVTSVAASVPTGLSVAGSPVTTTGTLAFTYTAGYQGYTSAEAALVASATQPGDNISTLTNDSGFTTNTGTVTSVGATVPTGLSISGSPVTTSGTLAITYTAGYQGYTSTEATKLSGIATGATANSADSYLLDRTNHTGAQATSTVTGLDTALADRVLGTARLTVGLTAPGSPTVGDLWVDTN